MLILAFEPTGTGKIECKRWNPDGTPKGSMYYDATGPKPLGLTPEQSDEYDVAVELELE